MSRTAVWLVVVGMMATGGVVGWVLHLLAPDDPMLWSGPKPGAGLVGGLVTAVLWLPGLAWWRYRLSRRYAEAWQEYREPSRGTVADTDDG